MLCGADRHALVIIVFNNSGDIFSGAVATGGWGSAIGAVLVEPAGYLVTAGAIVPVVGLIVRILPVIVFIVVGISIIIAMVDTLHIYAACTTINARVGISTSSNVTELDVAGFLPFKRRVTEFTDIPVVVVIMSQTIGGYMSCRVNGDVGSSTVLTGGGRLAGANVARCVWTVCAAIDTWIGAFCIADLDIGIPVVVVLWLLGDDIRSAAVDTGGWSRACDFM